MSRLEEVKKRKPFAIWDLLIYGILIAVILVLFGIFVFGGSGEAASGIQITTFDDKVIYTYDYDRQKGVVAEGWKGRVEEKNEDGVLLVTVYLDDAKKAYNILAIDTKNQTAVMRDANCRRKDCVSEKITSERDIIVCMTHKIKVCAIGEEKDEIFDPIIG
ncbi:MAG: NusG domain II-containing protein [Clostridia bacterium]|nr:NusG domain II-containing protein [Clostridia bacterium]